MQLRAVICGAILAVLLAADAGAAVRISNDKGGQIGPYLDAYVSLRKTGQRVIIDGPCLSACTIVLGVMPRDRICVTPRAQLGFHAAWNPGRNGRPVLSQAGTQGVVGYLSGRDPHLAETARRFETENGLSVRLGTDVDVSVVRVSYAFASRVRIQTTSAIDAPISAVTAIAP